MEKYKIVTISDHPLSNSGVGIRTKYLIDHLVSTGKFKVIAIGSAIKHNDYTPQKVKEWGDDVIIIPCDGYVNAELLRQIIDIEKPDALWFMSDPRFYIDLFRMENEIRSQMPLLWNTIWDNYLHEGDAPQYNKFFYDSCDFLGCINKLTFDIMKDLGFGEKAKYIPHGVPESDFKILYDTTQEKLKSTFLGMEHKDSFVLFYNSRNAIRKRTGNVIMAYKYFRDGLPEKEQKSVMLAMHTPPKDPEGQDLLRIIEDLKLNGTIALSADKIPPNVMCEFYNCADVTISMSSEEGFGLSILESLMCGTPVICTKTGGMQDQAIDDDGKQFGFCLEPHARSFIGSQITPYIWSDHPDPKKTSEYIRSLYDDWKKDKVGYKERWAGTAARESMLRRFNLKDVQKTWEQELIRTIEEFKVKKQNNKLTLTLI